MYVCIHVFCVCTGPNSSDTTDTDSHDETGNPGPGGAESCDHNGLPEDHHHHDDHRDHSDHHRRSRSHSGTPNLLSAYTDSSSHLSGSEASGGLEYSSALEDPPEDTSTTNEGAPGIISSKCVANNEPLTNRVPPNGVSVSRFNSDENGRRDSCETSDTDRTSVHAPPQYSSSVQRKLRGAPWSTKRFDSDFSTAPLSSETSDMDTSGHEKLGSDGGGSASDLTSLSRSDVSGEVFSSSQQRPKPVGASSLAQPSGSESSDSKKKLAKTTPKQNSVAQKVPGAAVASPTVSKRPLKASLSTPLWTGGNASPKPVSSGADSRGSLMSKVPPLRPKPPVGTKPAVKPKPPTLASTGETKSARPQPRMKLNSYSAGDKKSVDTTRYNGGKTVGGSDSSYQKLALNQGIRKATSESSFLGKGGLGNPSSSPTFVPRKLSNVREETEDKESASEKQATLQSTPPRYSPTLRPTLLPTKSKLPSSASKRLTPTPPPKPNTGPRSPTQNRGLSNSDNPAASPLSESASSLPCSPLIAKRKPAPPQKPALLAKKPGPLHQSASEGNLLNSTPGGQALEQNSPTPPEKPHTKRRLYRHVGSVPSQIGQTSSPSVTPSASPTPPVLPPRSPILPPREEGNNSAVRSSGSVSSAVTAPCTPSSTSSSQEEAPPPVPLHRAGGEKRTEATSPSSTLAHTLQSPPSDSDGQNPPPISRKSKPLQRQGSSCGSTGRKTIKSPPRRPPPSPPLSPSPPPIPTHSKTMGRSSLANTSTADPTSQKRHSLFSSALSATQIDDISQTYEVFDSSSQETKDLEKLYQQSLQLVTSESTGAESPKKSDAERKDSTGSASARRPHASHYEMTFLDPDRPPLLLSKCAGDSNGPASYVASEDIPPPLPSQPIPKKKGRQQQQQTLLKRGPIKARESASPQSQKSGDDSSPKSDSQSHESSENSAAWSRSPVPKEKVYDTIAAGYKVGKSPGLFRKIVRNDSKDSVRSSTSDMSPDTSFRRETKSFSSFMFRRSNSDRFKKNKLMNIVPTKVGNAFTMARQSLQRTPSVDKLDDRMERSVRQSVSKMEGESSSSDEDEDDETVVISPTHTG